MLIDRICKIEYENNKLKEFTYTAAHYDVIVMYLLNSLLAIYESTNFNN